MGGALRGYRNKRLMICSTRILGWNALGGVGEWHPPQTFHSSYYVSEKLLTRRHVCYLFFLFLLSSSREKNAAKVPSNWSIVHLHKIDLQDWQSLGVSHNVGI